jgi:ABC-type Fe3+ transport system substrate-binding protein
MLAKAKSPAAAKAFLQFLSTDTAKKVIRDAGYSVE